MTKMTACSLLGLMCIVLELITLASFAQSISDIKIMGTYRRNPKIAALPGGKKNVATPNNPKDNINIATGENIRENVEQDFLEVDGKYHDKSGNEVDPLSKTGVYVASNCGKVITKIDADPPKIVSEETPAVIGTPGSDSSPQQLSADIPYLVSAARISMLSSVIDPEKSFEVRVKALQIPNLVYANDVSEFIKTNGQYYVSGSGEHVKLFHDIGDFGLFIVYDDGEIIKRVNIIDNGVHKVTCATVPEAVWEHYYMRDWKNL